MNYNLTDDADGLSGSKTADDTIRSHELFLLRWNSNLTRSLDGAPQIQPRFVAEQGPSVRIADIRPQESATGVAGYIPGSAFVTPERLGQLAVASDCNSPLVIVSTDGAEAQTIALHLEKQGMKMVAAMKGGIADWRAWGFSTSRDPGGARTEFLSPRVAEAETGPVTLQHVRQHVGDPRSVRWIKLASMVEHGRFSCIDGRDERGIIGTPGGDAGEFLLSLAAIEMATGRQLDESTIENGLLARLDTFGHFCMHSDVNAFAKFIGALRKDDRFRGIVSGFTSTNHWAAFLQNPAPELQPALLEHAIDPAHIGCGHIRLMLLHSEEYGIRKALVIQFLRTFFRLWWAKSPETQLTILPDDHGEAAVLNIRLAEDIWGLSRIPLISPSFGGKQTFINHPDVASFLRKLTVNFLSRSSDPLSIELAQESNLQHAVEELAARQMQATVGYLAKGLPIFEVVFGADGTMDVSRIG